MRHEEQILRRCAAVVALLLTGLAVAGAGALNAKVERTARSEAASLIKKVRSPNDTPLKVTFNRTGQTEEVSFSGLNGEVIHIATSAGTFAANCDVQVSLKDSGGATLAGPVCGGQSGSLPPTTLPADGTFRILVAPNPTVTGSLMLSLTSTGSIRSITPNASGIKVNVSAGGSLKLGTIVENGVQLSALATNSKGFSGCSSYRLTILKPNNTVLATASACDTNPAFIDSSASTGAGTYSVKIDNLGATNGSTNLTIYSFLDQTAAIIPSAPGAIVKVKSDFPGQNAIASFSGTNGQQISATVTNAKGYTGCPSYAVNLVRPDGTVAATTSACGTADATLNATTLDQTGPWKVVLDPQGPATGSGTLTVFLGDVGGITPTPGGAVVPISITTPGQNQDASFSGTIGQKISVQVTGASAGLQASGYVIRLLRPDGSELAGVGSNGATAFLDAQTLDQTGTWKVRFDPIGSGTGTATETVYLVVDQTVAITPSGGGATVNVNLTTPGQNNVATFNGTSAQKISVQVTGASSGLQASGYSIKLVGPDGTTLAAVFSSGPTAFMDAQTLDQTGTWTVVFDPSSTGLGTATEKVFLVGDGGGGITPTPGGAVVPISITTPGQNQDASFSGTIGQKISVQVTGASAGLQASGYVIRLLRPDGSELAGVGSNGATAFLDAQTLDQTGTWKVRFDPIGSGTGTATETVYLVVDQTVAITPSGGGATVNVNLTTPGQNNVATFNGTSAQKISVQVTGASSGLQASGYSIKLVGPDGTTLAAVFSSGPTAFMDAQTLDQTGTWTVVFDPSSTGLGTATEKVFLVGDGGGGITPTPGGAVVPISITTPGQNQDASFSGTIGQKISVQVTGASAGLQASGYVIRLLRPDGSELAGVGSNGATAFLDAQTLDQTGTWKVRFDPIGSGTGTATETVYLVVDQTVAITPSGGGATVNVNLTTPGQNNVATFNGTSAQKISVQVTGASSGLQASGYSIKLVGPDGTTLAAVFSSGPTAFMDAQTLDQTGTWTVVFDPSSTGLGTATEKVFLVP